MTRELCLISSESNRGGLIVSRRLTSAARALAHHTLASPLLDTVSVDGVVMTTLSLTHTLTRSVFIIKILSLLQSHQNGLEG